MQPADGSFALICIEVKQRRAMPAPVVESRRA